VYLLGPWQNCGCAAITDHWRRSCF